MQHVEPDDEPINDPAPLDFSEPWSYELHFPRDPRGPAIARTTLKAVLSAHGLGALIDRAELLASELTSNAVRHSKGPATVRLRWENPVLRVSVTDTCLDLPVRCRTVRPEAERGRGLLILDLFADSWGGCGVDEALFGVGGKTVWFELVFGDGPPFPSATALAA